MEPLSPSSTDNLMIEQLRSAIADLQLPDHKLQDKNLLRWLRARNNNVKDAELMIRKNDEWLIDAQIRDIWNGSEIQERFLSEFPFPATGFDSHGCPVFVSRMGQWDVQKVMAEGRKKDFIRYGIFLMERASIFCTRLSENKNYVLPFVGIYDFEGLSLRQLTSADVIEAAVTMSKIFEANYPESLKVGIVVNAPWAFQILWKLLRPFLTERTRSKVIFLGSDVEVWRETISKIVPLDQLPQHFGGTADNASMIQIEKDGSWRRITGGGIIVT